MLECTIWSLPSMSAISPPVLVPHIRSNKSINQSIVQITLADIAIRTSYIMYVYILSMLSFHFVALLAFIRSSTHYFSSFHGSNLPVALMYSNVCFISFVSQYKVEYIASTEHR